MKQWTKVNNQKGQISTSEKWKLLYELLTIFKEIDNQEKKE